MALQMTRPTKNPKTGNYQVRKSVPPELRPIIRKAELKRSLGTKDRAVAMKLGPPAIAEFDAIIAAARAKLEGRVRRLPPREVAALVGQWYRAEAARIEAAPGDPEKRDIESDILLDERTDPEEPGVILPAPEDRATADALLAGLGIAADAETRAIAADYVARATLDLARLAVRRAEADWSPDDAADRFPSPDAAAPGSGGASPAPLNGERPPLPAKELMAAWAAERSPARATAKKYAIAFGHVARILGFDDVRRIRPDDVVAFKAARLGEGRDPGTVADEVLAAGAVCNWAVTNRLLASNPFAGLAPRLGRRGPAARDGYDDDEAARILRAARKATGWQRWLPWLLCFTGARISEIAELRRGDVRKESGIWILDIKPTAERAGKNATFQRKLPLHPAVVDEGFLAYVASLPPAPTGPLFPDLAPAADGTRTTTATTIHGRWVRGAVGITDGRKAPAHSWRHRMEDQLRMVRALPEVVDAITGRHNPRNAGAGYGRGFRGMPDEVLKDLAKIPSPLAGHLP